MATIIGTAGVDWGMSAESWGVAQSFLEGKTCNISEIKDVDGDIKGASFYGQTNNASLVFLTNTAPNAVFGTSVVFSNSELGATYYPTSFSLSKSNTGFFTGTVNAIAFPA